MSKTKAYAEGAQVPPRCDGPVCEAVGLRADSSFVESTGAPGRMCTFPSTDAQGEQAHTRLSPRKGCFMLLVQTASKVP